MDNFRVYNIVNVHLILIKLPNPNSNHKSNPNPYYPQLSMSKKLSMDDSELSMVHKIPKTQFYKAKASPLHCPNFTISLTESVRDPKKNEFEKALSLHVVEKYSSLIFLR